MPRQRVKEAALAEVLRLIREEEPPRPSVRLSSSEALPSPLQGTVFKVAVEQGAEVAEGDLICVIEAMKMENEITAHQAGKVSKLNVSEGAAINSCDPIATIE